MAKTDLTLGQKRLNADLWIIVVTSTLALAAYVALQSQIYATLKDTDTNILLRLLLVAAFQFGTAGLGISIVSAIRKESFRSHGLRMKGTLPSIALCSLCFVPYIVFRVFRLAAGLPFDGYMPFQTVATTREVLASPMPYNVLGMAVTAIAWGFFEGFNYVVISDKINLRFPSRKKWLNRGAIVCAIMCILVHGAIGVSIEGMLETIAIMAIVYGMLMVKEFTQNAWGCVFVFVFLWNAF